MTCPMPSDPPTQDPEEITTGPRNGTFRVQQTKNAFQVSDVVRSIHDPERDLLLPSLYFDQWQDLRKLSPSVQEDVVRALIAWESTTRTTSLLSQPAVIKPMARQEGPALQDHAHLRAAAAAVCEKYRKAGAGDVVKLFPEACQSFLPGSAGSAADLENVIALRDSARLFLDLRDQFLRAADGVGAVTVDLRENAPWWTVDDQKDTAGCVGYAVAGMTWRQAGLKPVAGKEALTKPSARYFWQGAKEMDGEERPTTFILSAGTSVRAALNLGRTYGVAMESEVPSDHVSLRPAAPLNDVPPPSLDAFYTTIGQRRFTGVTRLNRDSKNLLAWLSTGRPAVAILWGDSNFVDLGTRPAVPDYNPKDPALFLHAVVVAGFRLREKNPLLEALERADRNIGPDPAQKDRLQLDFLVRNSYGTSWGDQGYAWVDHRQFRLRCTETYGVWAVHGQRDTGVSMDLLSGGGQGTAQMSGG